MGVEEGVRVAVLVGVPVTVGVLVMVGVKVMVGERVGVGLGSAAVQFLRLQPEERAIQDKVNRVRPKAQLRFNFFSRTYSRLIFMMIDKGLLFRKIRTIIFGRFHLTFTANILICFNQPGKFFE